MRRVEEGAPMDIRRVLPGGAPGDRRWPADTVLNRRDGAAGRVLPSCEPTEVRRATPGGTAAGWPLPGAGGSSGAAAAASQSAAGSSSWPDIARSSRLRPPVLPAAASAGEVAVPVGRSGRCSMPAVIRYDVSSRGRSARLAGQNVVCCCEGSLASSDQELMPQAALSAWVLPRKMSPTAYDKLCMGYACTANFKHR